MDDKFGEVFSITGIDDAGRIIFSGSQSPLATGKPLGFSYAQADLFFGVKPLDIESVGKLPRWVWNDKGDGMGTDVAEMTGSACSRRVARIVSRVQRTVRCARRDRQRGAVLPALGGPTATTRAVLYTDVAASGNVNLTVGAQTFRVQSRAASSSRQAQFRRWCLLNTDGNIIGTVWSNWGAADAFSAISLRIESRAQAWAAIAQAGAVTAARMAGAVDFEPSGSNGAEYAGYVMTAAPTSAVTLTFPLPSAATLHRHSGWVVAFDF